jgi:hypothetical protein
MTAIPAAISTANSGTQSDANPLSVAEQRLLAESQTRVRKIRRAAAVARFNGWTTGIAAFCSLPFALMSLAGLAVTLTLGVVAANEFRGQRRLLQFDPRGATLLGWNQVGLLAAIVVYSLGMLWVGLTGESPLAAELAAKPELASVFDSAELDQAYQLIVVAVYATTIAFSLLFQGLNALYYFTRRPLVLEYAQTTPAWVLDLQRVTLE